MEEIERIEGAYRKYMKDLSRFLPEGIVEVDIALLQRFNLLVSEEEEVAMTRYFHAIETNEKITLINDEFVIWIVPETFEGPMKTYVFIALHTYPEPSLEMAYAACGVYNSSHLVLQLLEKFLTEIEETERTLAHLKQNK